MLDESAAVPFEPGAGAQRVLEWRERADPAGVLDGDAPQGARHVQPHDPAPPPGEEPAEHDERHEGGVHEHHGIGEDPVDHSQTHSIRRKPPPDQGPAGARVWPVDVGLGGPGQAPREPAGANNASNCWNVVAMASKIACRAVRSSAVSSWPPPPAKVIEPSVSVIVA